MSADKLTVRTTAKHVAILQEALKLYREKLAKEVARRQTTAQRHDELAALIAATLDIEDELKGGNLFTTGVNIMDNKFSDSELIAMEYAMEFYLKRLKARAGSHRLKALERRVVERLIQENEKLLMRLKALTAIDDDDER